MTICFLVQSWMGVPRPIRLYASQYLKAFESMVMSECFDAVNKEATDDPPFPSEKKLIVWATM